MLVTKSEIARRQLEVAAQLYSNNADYLAVITLAGAAEEILGALLRHSGRDAMIDCIIEMDTNLTGGRPFKVVSDEVNRARNALKHFRISEENAVLIEPGEATAMLARALFNYKRLSGQLTEPMLQAFKRLVSELAQDGGVHG
jgi:hypothetical protein